MKKIAVLLAGCGVYDGSEIHEAVFALLSIEKAGHAYRCFAPNKAQFHVVDHLTGEPTHEKRNVLSESARIARGNVRNIQDVRAGELDALIFPGGYGAAKNLSSFAFKGADCTVHGDVTRLVKQMHQAGKPIGVICISPVVAAKIFGGEIQLELTIGNERETAEAIERMGAKHVEVPVTEIVVDRDNKVVSTPAYMCAKTISEAATGIEKLVRAVLDMA